MAILTPALEALVQYIWKHPWVNLSLESSCNPLRNTVMVSITRLAKDKPRIMPRERWLGGLSAETPGHCRNGCLGSEGQIRVPPHSSPPLDIPDPFTFASQFSSYGNSSCQDSVWPFILGKFTRGRLAGWNHNHPPDIQHEPSPSSISLSNWIPLTLHFCKSRWLTWKGDSDHLLWVVWSSGHNVLLRLCLLSPSI